MRKITIHLTKLAIVPALFLATNLTARASSIAILNPSFESPIAAAGPGAVVDPSGYSYNQGPGAITDWNDGPGSGVFNPHVNTDPVNPFYTPIGLPEMDQDQVAYSNGSLISQTLTATLAARTKYTLSVLVGDRTDVNNTNTTFSYGLYDATTSTLLAGAENVTEAAAFTGLKGTFANEIGTYTSGTTNVGDALQVRLFSSTIQYDFDNVLLNATPVPLPAAGWTGLALMGGVVLARQIAAKTKRSSRYGSIAR